MRLAAMAGLEVADVEIGTAGPSRFLQVLRYDRKPLDGGQLERIHHEDFCQALGIPPELKYQQESGPNLKKCFELVRAVSSVPGPDVLRLFDAVVFNYLMGNNDAHGKNFPFLYRDGAAGLAPLYDLVCTQAPHRTRGRGRDENRRRAQIRPDLRKKLGEVFQRRGCGASSRQETFGRTRPKRGEKGQGNRRLAPRPDICFSNRSRKLRARAFAGGVGSLRQMRSSCPNRVQGIAAACFHLSPDSPQAIGIPRVITADHSPSRDRGNILAAGESGIIFPM